VSNRVVRRRRYISRKEKTSRAYVGYLTLLETAEYLLGQSPRRVMFLDGRPFSRRYQIENVINAADSLRQPWRILECVCSEETARRRLETDAATGAHPAGNRNFELYLEVKSRFERIVYPKTIIDTDQALEVCVDLAMAAISISAV
jgi:adenylylsulfate kinase